MPVDDEDDGVLQVFHREIMDADLTVPPELPRDSVRDEDQHFQTVFLLHPHLLSLRSGFPGNLKNFLHRTIITFFFAFARCSQKIFLVSENKFASPLQFILPNDKLMINPHYYYMEWQKQEDRAMLLIGNGQI